MTTVDMQYPALGDGLPTDHGYPLYAALSGVVPELHDPAFPARVSAVSGEPAGGGRLRLTDRSVLRVRVPADRIAAVLPLAGRRLEVGSDAVRLGVPRVAALVPAPTVFARVVTLMCSGRDDQEKRRSYMDVDPSLEAVRRRLSALGVAGEATVPLVRGGKWAGTPVRRVVRVDFPADC